MTPSLSLRSESFGVKCSSLGMTAKSCRIADLLISAFGENFCVRLRAKLSIKSLTSSTFLAVWIKFIFEMEYLQFLSGSVQRLVATVGLGQQQNNKLTGSDNLLFQSLLTVAWQKFYFIICIPLDGRYNSRRAS